MTCPCSGIKRRDFLRVTGAGTMAWLASRLPVMAGPFTKEDFEKLIPTDKKLDPDWVKSLFARGEPQIYRGAELDLIGMPIGGLCAGQLYLGGDGKLWHWDIFNQPIGTGDAHYAHPLQPASPVAQGFALDLGGKTIPLDKRGFADIRFRGEYPMATVEYRDAGVPVTVTLEAFSPFILLNPDDSGLPATVMQFTVKNASPQPVEATLTGSLENAVCLHHRVLAGQRCNRIVSGNGFTFLECSAQEETSTRADIVFENWDQATYEGWTVEGTAFGSGPVRKAEMPGYQGDVGGDTERVVNSHAAAPGNDTVSKDNATGKLTSRPFTLARNFVVFWIGGGNFPGKTCLNLVVEGRIVQSATGQNDNRMALQHFDVRSLQGKEAVIEIVDDQAGGWGNLGVGRITFSDRPTPVALEQLPDYGTLGLALLGAPAEVAHAGDLAIGVPVAAEPGPKIRRLESCVPLAQRLHGELGRKGKLGAGQSATATFVLAWHFPNLTLRGARDSSRHYAMRFNSARTVVAYVADQFDRLAAATRLWRDTWYDSTLPYWFLDRTFMNTSILATSTAHRFKSGRFYGWEGVGCCAGTCTSVWYYAQAVARLFPSLERSAREMQDFADGVGFDPATGGVYTRGEFRGDFVLDGQAGNVLRVYREHQMSADSAFLKRNWGKTRQALEWLLRQDGNGDGIIDGWQSTTLDCGFWWGAMSWTSSLYLAALCAGAAMAREVGDVEFAERAGTVAEAGAQNLVARLWNGEYFIHKPDRSQPRSFVIGNGCHIDQVYGQAWANQVGLGRILPASHTQAALRSIWKYNFTPDVGPYRKKNAEGRWYAMAGEGGVIMTTWPHGDREKPKIIDGGMSVGVGYLNECMTGFEHQVAGHMLGEGLVLEGLAVERSIHDRYHPLRRNPWNEVECGDHYSRAMASYGVFLEACGFEYHGPRGHIGFAPRLTPENFKAAFTSAEGWGSYSQKIEAHGRKPLLSAQIAVNYGKLRVKTIALGLAKDFKPGPVKIEIQGKPVVCATEVREGKMMITLAVDILLKAGESVSIVVD